jgi:MerT mercuric transport protein
VEVARAQALTRNAPRYENYDATGTVLGTIVHLAQYLFQTSVVARDGTECPMIDTLERTHAWKVAWVSVVTAVTASVYCIGPVVAVTLGAGALTAGSVRFERHRPALTVALLGFAFYRVFRPSPADCAADSTCSDPSGEDWRTMAS